MAKRRVMIEVRKNNATMALAAGGAPMLGRAVEPRASAASVPGFQMDPSFEAVSVPSREFVASGRVSPLLNRAMASVNAEPELVDETYIVRGSIEEEALPMAAAAVLSNPLLVDVYSDPPIQPFITCGATPPVGTHATVAAKLSVPALQLHGMTGKGVYVAIVDTGFNLPYLNGKGINPNFDAALSWVPAAGLIPGQLPVDHGTMCAFDVCIAAPECTLIDIAVLRSKTPGGTAMEGLLSDAVRAYGHLRTILAGSSPPKALVVSNSWGMFHPGWDYPIGHPGNYSDNANHPFNRIVQTLEREGADILFAAGNCGGDCPDGRCSGVTDAIYGANSHPRVLSVAGVDINDQRVGYSTRGPGRLSADKPDVAGYTHFAGSGVYPADSGTSAATPVVAGLVAALRSQWAYNVGNPDTWPGAVRELMKKTAVKAAPKGYDPEYGWGIVNGLNLANAVTSPVVKAAKDGLPPAQPAATAGVATTKAASGIMGKATTGGLVQLTTLATPGANVHYLDGLPPGTFAISLWICQCDSNGLVTTGQETCTTTALKLENGGTKCRIEFQSNASGAVPVAAHYICSA